MNNAHLVELPGTRRFTTCLRKLHKTNKFVSEFSLADCHWQSSPSRGSTQQSEPTKKLHPRIDEVFVVEHLEKSSPLIIEEVRRWRDLLWDDYLDYKYKKERASEVHNP